MPRCFAQRPRHVDVLIRLSERTTGYYAKCIAINGAPGNAIGRESDSMGAAIEGAIVSSLVRLSGYEDDPKPFVQSQLVFDFAK